MELTDAQFIECWNRYKEFVDQISEKYQYPSNISHLLYLIIPAFVLQYGIRSEKRILKLFEKTKIIIEDKNDSVHQAAFVRSLKEKESGYYTEKFVYLYYYENISLMGLLDNLLHEFNHAMNSIKNEILCNETGIFVRGGLSYFLYDKKSLIPVGKQKEFVLEEIINTRQVESLIEEIASFGKYSVSDTVFINVLYAIRKEVSNGYHSQSYYLESTVCRRLLENKTFIYTLEKLRFQGEVLELDYWFDNIVGKKGRFQYLNDTLVEIMHLEEKLAFTKWFKKRVLRKIEKLCHRLFDIIEKFDQNCNLK